MNVKGGGKVTATKSKTRLPDSDTEVGNESEEYMSKLRIDFIDDDVAPQDIRGLLAKFGKVGDVSIHSGQDYTYALADMLPKEAEEATDQLHGRHWRGTSIGVVFANRAFGKTWLSGHSWSPPMRERWY
jgi:hypothetical protein